MDVAKHTMKVRLEESTLASRVCVVQQTTAPALRIGDRVRVTNSGLQLL